MIVYPNDNWILERSGRELEGLEVAGTYFLNYYLFDETQPKPWGAFFTHKEPKYAHIWDKVAQSVEYAVCLNENTKRELEETVKTVVIIRHGHDPRVKKEISFGVSGVRYPGGRKGEELIDEAIKRGHHILWNEDFEQQPEFYRKIDYLLVPSRLEGGPVPVIDALASGVPVVARKGVGWCDDFPAIRFSTDEEFHEILWKLTNPPTWEGWQDGHMSLFASVNSSHAGRS